MLTAFLSACCFLAIIWGIQSHLPWPIFIPLALAGAVFFVWESDED